MNIKEALGDTFYVSASKDIDVETEKLFKHYRAHGFPNYEKENYSIEKEYNKLRMLDACSIYDADEKEIGQSMVGCGILWTYFPHWIEVGCGGTQSLVELWNDDEKLRALIRKTYAWKIRHNECHWTNNRIRQNAKVYLAKQSVSNFRPSVAKYLYDRYGNNGNVFDMSAGYGGRLFGFHASQCRGYVGCEPCTKTYEGLLKLQSDLHALTSKNARILKQGSEDYIEDMNGYFDMCFTSPPYFNTERYSEEVTQSYIKYPTYNEWSQGFLNDTIRNCYTYLKDGGYMLINIANVKAHDLQGDTIKLAQNNGFRHVDTLYMVLSSIAGRGKKHEPIFVFKKI